MPRIKVKIENDTQRRATYKKRQKVAYKKAQELSILCDCKVASIRYSEYHTEPVVYPNYQVALDTYNKFKELSSSAQLKHMMMTEEFIKKIIDKKKDQLYKLQRENDLKEKTNMMHEVARGKKISKDINGNDLMYAMKRNLEMFRKLKIKVDEEGSTLYASQPISSDSPVSTVPLASPSIVSSGTDREGPRSPLMVPEVAQVIEDKGAPLIIPSSPSTEMIQQLFHPVNPPQMVPFVDPSWISSYSLFSAELFPPLVSQMHSCTHQQIDLRRTPIMDPPLPSITTFSTNSPILESSTAASLLPQDSSMNNFANY
ncbi:agamous-like MADS-box protein AGL80 [Solanum lycopersicum]|uniref:agamous-like MADS-box protein AGL80 n=1 Tax=Solanum lycopersicum TaxID=4081 RepID=UPI003747D66C